MFISDIISLGKSFRNIKINKSLSTDPLGTTESNKLLLRNGSVHQIKPFSTLKLEMTLAF